MSTREEASFGQTCLRLAIGACFLLVGYLSFVSVLSILVGVRSAPQPGFWVPILVGLACVFPVLWALARVTRQLLSQMVEEDIVRI